MAVAQYVSNHQPEYTNQEIDRIALYLHEAMHQSISEGIVHRDFPTIPVIHTDSFTLNQFSQVYPSFLERMGEIKETSRKHKKETYFVATHAYIAEGRLDIDSLRDSLYFQSMMDMLTSQNFKMLIRIKEKRTIRKVVECMTYGDAADATANEFAKSTVLFNFIADDGENSDSLTATQRSNNLYVFEGAKWVPTVRETTALTLTAAETDALKIKKTQVDGAKLVEDLINLHDAYNTRAERDLIMGSEDMLSVVRMPRPLFSAIKSVDAVTNADFTDANRNALTAYPEALMVGGLTIVPDDTFFALYEQSDDKGANIKNIEVNYDQNVHDYSKAVFGDGTGSALADGAAGHFPVAVAYTRGALIHAEVMPIRLRMFRTEKQQMTTMYFEMSSDTIIKNPGEVIGLVAKPGV